MLLPWRMIRTWKCLACGDCCRVYRPILTDWEAEYYQRKYGKAAVDKIGTKPVIRKINNKCVFQQGNLCSLGDDKPLSCKQWPFLIYRHPLRFEDRELASFEMFGETWYVYVDSFCRGINLGDIPVEDVIKEVIKIHVGLQKSQFFTTSLIKKSTMKVSRTK
ncbi:MAG: YkgJ family cysteine cluster protein [Candidatus Asgardarchaeia archaeon]